MQKSFLKTPFRFSFLSVALLFMLFAVAPSPLTSKNKMQTMHPIKKNLSPTELFLRGKKQFEKKDYLATIATLEKFTQENPYEIEMRDALFLLGRSYQEEGEHLDAIACFNRLLSRFPHSPYRKQNFFYMGSSYYALKIFARARQNLQSFIEENKRPELAADELARSYIYLARMFQEERRYNNALSEYEKAYRLMQSYHPPVTEDKIFMQDILFQMGSLYARYTGNKILAYRFLQMALSQGLPKSDKLDFLLRDLTLFHIDQKEGLRDISIADIQIDGDDIWIATWNGGVYRYVRSLEQMQHIPIPSPQARSVFIEQNSIFVATFDGIYIYDKKSNRIHRLNKDNSYFSLAQKIIKDDRYIYISTLSSGVIRYDYIRDETKVLDENSYIGSRQIYSMDADHKYLVFGTLANGVVLLDKEKNETHYINSSRFAQMRGRNIKAVLIDGRYLWFAEHLSGIYKYDIVQKKIVLHDNRFHFPSSLLKREKEIWVGLSGEGIAVYSQDSKKVTVINAIDGLYSNEVHILRGEDDYVWIGYLDSGIDVLYSPILE